jgi:hypothetical protein
MIGQRKKTFRLFEKKQIKKLIRLFYAKLDLRK